MLLPWLAVGYPVLAHAGVWSHNLYLQWFALVWLLIVMLGPTLAKRRLWSWSALVLGAAALYWLTMHGEGMYLLYVPPIAIPLFIMWLFARTLTSGETPLVSRIAEAMRGEPLPDVLRAYTRNVTRLWVLVAAGLFVSAVASALWASAEVWSLITNVVHYLVMGAVFVIEFAYRRVKYAALEPWGLAQYLRRLAHTRIRI